MELTTSDNYKRDNVKRNTSKIKVAVITDHFSGLGIVISPVFVREPGQNLWMKGPLFGTLVQLDTVYIRRSRFMIKGKCRWNGRCDLQ